MCIQRRYVPPFEGKSIYIYYLEDKQICAYSLISLITHMFILVWSLDIYFILWDIIQHWFTRNICSIFFSNLTFGSSFSYLLCLLTYFYHCGYFCLIKFIFECFPTLLHLKMSLVHIYFFAPVLISDFFPSIPLSFYWIMILHVRILTS